MYRFAHLTTQALYTGHKPVKSLTESPINQINLSNFASVHVRNRRFPCYVEADEMVMPLLKGTATEGL